MPPKAKTTEGFIQRARSIHGDKYDYSKVDYINARTKISIICPIHGKFEQIANNHIKKIRPSGCLTCGNQNQALTENYFVAKAKKLHGDKYDYSKVIYLNAHTKVCIVCPKHGEFCQKPYSHLMGKGCPKCNESKGEKEIAKILKINNIKFIREYRYDNCRYINTLPFDFYLPNKNTCIEYDGIQHFEPVDFFGGEHTLIETQKRDTIKTQYCKDNGIKLIRIRYDDDIINKLNNVITPFVKNIYQNGRSFLYSS